MNDTTMVTSTTQDHNDAGVLNLEALIAEQAAARAADWAARQASRRGARAAHQTARNHGLQARHTRKLARQETKP